MMLGCLFILSILMRLGLSFTERPIIGIMTMELENSLKPLYPGYDSYIASSYVKAIESSGARAIPVFIGRTEAYYKKIAESVNGILIPGGGAPFSGVDNFFSASKTMFNLALEMNAKNIHFPVFGVCLGFELLLHFANNDIEIRKRCDLEHLNMPLDFSSGFKKGKLYRSMSRSLVHIFQTNITVNNHIWCIYPEDFNNANLGANWKILSTTNDLNGEAFISSIEHKKYPIFGVQFHPEKNIFEWGRILNFPHSAKAIAASRYFYDWFVNQARKNDNSFSEVDHEQNSLIYNYAPSYTDLHTLQKLNFTQTYFFRTKYLDP